MTGSKDARRIQPGKRGADGSAHARRTNSSPEHKIQIEMPRVFAPGGPRKGNIREGAQMSRELTRQFKRNDSTPVRLDHLQIQINQSERTVRVSLSGTLDCAGVEKLISRVAPRLVSRGCRIILDGSRLTHLDFRATHSLICWNRRLRDFNHQLYLREWSDYLKAILVMEDWDRELGAAGSEPATWRLLGATSTVSQP